MINKSCKENVNTAVINKSCKENVNTAVHVVGEGFNISVKNSTSMN